MSTSASGQNDNEGHRPPTPFRQIRARFDEESITVYQAYNSAIAAAAVEAQRLDASPGFKVTRMTWIKPSWAWMMYRAGYSFKDPGRERILALKMRHGDFVDLLRKGVGDCSAAAYRSAPPPDICRDWVATMIVGIEDVTARARELKRVLEERPGVGDGELIDLGLLPAEKEFEVPKDVEELLEMNLSERPYD
ncbi:hypothetical protein CGRA01v4_05820 [Colletotrichum graminicola]|nr:hypothetical protein CGRA01v4_05820 [Colletotrichum graminicola]